ncbi:MAG: ABC transporter ATP-binding protein [Chloroflexi bacterium]|nr:ABC transporter ATP-binding protein [Chloroflexota bacterium]
MKIPTRAYWQLLQRYLAPQRGAVLLMSGLLLASISLQLTGPQVVRLFLDALQAGAGIPLLIRSALLFIGVTALQQVLSVGATYWSERVAWTATNQLRADLTAHLLQLDPSFHTAHTPGELIERVDGDVNELAGFFSSFIVQLVGSALLLMGVLIAVYWLNVQLGLAFTAFVGLTLGLMGRVWQGGTPHWQADRECSANFYGYIGEVFTATEDLRASNAMPYVLRRFFEVGQRWWPVRLQASIWGQSVMNAAIIALAMGEALAYGMGGKLYWSGAISLGAVYLVLAYTAMLGAPIETLRIQLQDLQRANASIIRVRELLAIRSKLTGGAERLPQGALGVEFHAVTFSYQEQPAPHHENAGVEQAVLHTLSLALKPGRVLGVLGHTGSGKTTLARLLFRLYDPQQGAVRLGGVDLRDVQLSALRARIGLVTQDVQLFEASLRDNITFFDATITDARLLTVLEQLGLQTWLAQLPNGLDTPIASTSLSAGEAQLVALARVFIKNPGLVILDEASSRLDPATEALLDRALDTLLQGRTAIIIAHRLATVERADEILILEQGRVLEQKSRQQLVADPNSRFTQLRRIGLAEVLV